jgi:hypothetical protein
MKTTPLDELISDMVMDVTSDLHSSYGASIRFPW